jgi:hypothetical protein
MSGGRKAVTNGEELKVAVVAIANTLGLESKTEYKVGRRLWGAARRIDVILRNPATRETLGVECKFQSTPGTAEEKIPGTIQDIKAWPIRGLVVFSGPGFTENMKSFLISTGYAVELDELEQWLRLYFGLELVNGN